MPQNPFGVTYRAENTGQLADQLNGSDLAGLSYGQLLAQLQKDLPRFLQGNQLIGSATTAGTQAVAGAWYATSGAVTIPATTFTHIPTTVPIAPPSGGALVNSSGFFVAPVSGWYLLTATILFASNAAANRMIVAACPSGVPAGSPRNDIQMPISTDPGFTSTGIWPLVAGAQAGAYAYAGTATTTYTANTNTSFAAALLGTM